MTTTPKDEAKNAARAMSDLNMLYAIIALVDNSLMHDCNTAERQIVKICKTRALYLLKKYDRHIANISALADKAMEEKP
jgi:hypothetical protein